jgi:hypothetical protein
MACPKWVSVFLCQIITRLGSAPACHGKLKSWKFAAEYNIRYRWRQRLIGKTQLARLIKDLSRASSFSDCHISQ